jgi:hypothetical protein
VRRIACLRVLEDAPGSRLRSSRGEGSLLSTVTGRACIRLECSCGHVGSILVTRHPAVGESYELRRLHGKGHIFLKGAPTMADIVASVLPSCPSCHRKITVAQLKGVSKEAVG